MRGHVLLVVLAAGSCARGGGAETRSAIVWNPPPEVARGAGEKGPWRQNDSRFDYVDDPSVALAPDGAAVVAWVDQGDKQVLLQIYDAAGTPRHTAPVRVSRSPEVFSWLPRVALSPAEPEHVYVLWQEIIFSGGSHGGEMFFARSRDSGASFDEPLNLSRSRAGDGKGRLDRDTWHNGSFDLAVAPDGTVHVAWTEYDGRLWTARSTDRGASFTQPLLVLAGEPHPGRAPALAVAADTVYLAWTVGEDRSADIRLARSDDAGATFGSHVFVERTAGYADAPKLAVEPGGVLHVAWAQSAAGFFDRSHVRYTRSRDGGKTFDPSRDVSRPLPRGFESAAFPSLDLDPAGERVVVSWELYPSVRQPPSGLGLSYSLDGGDAFAAPAIVEGSRDPGGNGSFQGRLMRKLAVRDGAIVVVNSALRLGEASRVWLVRGALPASLVARN
jgi:hypothetical protein